MIWVISFVYFPVFMPHGLLGVMRSRFDESIDFAVARRTYDAGIVATPEEEAEPEGNELSWQPYSLELLERHIADSKTVFIDFTAPS